MPEISAMNGYFMSISKDFRIYWDNNKPRYPLKNTVEKKNILEYKIYPKTIVHKLLRCQKSVVSKNQTNESMG